jgi:hypothetical protein
MRTNTVASKIECDLVRGLRKTSPRSLERLDDGCTLDQHCPKGQLQREVLSSLKRQVAWRIAAYIGVSHTAAVNHRRNFNASKGHKASIDAAKIREMKADGVGIHDAPHDCT